MGASRPNSASGTLDPAKTPDAVDTPAAASSIMQNEDEKAPELTPTKSSEPPPHLEGFKVFLVILATSFIMLLATLDISIMSTAIPKITSEFHRLEDVGWYVGAYLLASATCQPLTGKLYTHFSTKWTYLIFIILFEIGSAICGSAKSSQILIGGRALSGVGASGLINGTMTVIMGAAKPEKRPMYTGAAMGVAQIGVVLGPLLGGIFTEHATWRWCFYINLPIGGASITFLSLLTIPDQVHKPKVTMERLRALLPRLDLIGFALFAPAAIMLLLALQFGSGTEYVWSDSEVIGLFCGAGATFIVFIFWERHMGKDAMIPGHILSQKIVVCSALFFGLLMSSISIGSNYMPMYLQSSKGLSPTMSGVYMLGSIIPQSIFVILSGGLVTKFGYYMPWCFFAASLTAVGAGLISTWVPSTGLGKLLGYQVLFGVRGAGMQMAIIAVQHYLPRKEVAIGNSIVVLAQNFIGSVFVTVGNVILQETLKSEIHKNAPSIDPDAAIAAGGSAENVRALAPNGAVRDALLNAYAAAVSNIFIMLAVMCSLSVFVAFGMGWVDLRAPISKPNDAPPAEAPKKDEAPGGDKV